MLMEEAFAICIFVEVKPLKSNSYLPANLVLLLLL